MARRPEAHGIPQLIHRKKILHPWQSPNKRLAHCLNNFFGLSKSDNPYTEEGLNPIPRPQDLSAKSRKGISTMKPYFVRTFESADGAFVRNILARKVGRSPDWLQPGTEVNSNHTRPDYEVIGILVTQVITSFFFPMRHWVAIRKIGDEWYRFDSRDSIPYQFRYGPLIYLQSILNKDGHVFVVRRW